MEEETMFDFKQAIKLWEEYLNQKNIIFVKKEDNNNNKLMYLLVSKTNVKIRMEIDHQEISTSISVKLKDAQNKSSKVLEEFASRINSALLWDERLEYNANDQSFKYIQYNTLINADDIIDVFNTSVGIIMYISKILISAIELITTNDSISIDCAVNRTLEFTR
jgi:hypothetical protein